MEELELIGEDFNPPVFDFIKIFGDKKHYALGFFGSRNAGKTTLLKHITNELKKKFDLIIWCCESKSAEIYREIFGEDDSFLIETHTDQLLWDLLKFQKLTDNYLDILVVYDDMSDLAKIKNSKPITKIAIRGRNANISLLYSTQDDIMLNTTVRRNLDFSFLLQMNADGPAKLSERWLDNVYKFKGPLKYKGKTKRCRYLMNFYEHFTSDHGIIVIAYREVDNKIFQYKTPMNGKDPEILNITGKKRKKEEKEEKEEGEKEKKKN